MRVIAGRLGGRRLSAPKGMATRPTTDRVREALFSVLGDLTDLAVLDLYAGTGALGIEAISRGARRAVFVESSRPAIVALRKNIDDLGVTSQARVLAQPVARAIDLIVHEGPFDLVLVDPPYALLNEAAVALRKLVARGQAFLASGGRLVLEHASRDAPPALDGQDGQGGQGGQGDRALELQSTRSYGEASLSFYGLVGM